MTLGDARSGGTANAAPAGVPAASATGPLAGRRIVVTRAPEQARELVTLLEARGAEVLIFPCIAIASPESWDAVDEAIVRLTGETAAYDWVLFTSANGVTRFLGRCETLGVRVSDLAASHVAAVGPATAEALADRGIQTELLPEEYVGEGLLEALRARGVGVGSRVLLPRAQEARDVLPDGLAACGARVDVVPVYRTVDGAGDPVVLERLRACEVDAVTFTSPSTVRGFCRLTAGILAAMPVSACIGPVAAAEARARGFVVAVEPAEHTVPGLVRALGEYFSD